MPDFLVNIHDSEGPRTPANGTGGSTWYYLCKLLQTV